jgi:hypothetical protein
VHVAPTARLAGLSIAERVLRSAWRAGYGRAIVRADPAAPAFSGLGGGDPLGGR